MYFDSEVNRILSKIKNSKVLNKKIAPCEVDIGRKKKLMNCNKIFNKGSKKFIDNYKKNLMKDLYKNSFSNTEKTLWKSKAEEKKNYDSINRKNL